MDRIEHVALWCRNLEAMRSFYCLYFGAHPSPRYVNPRTVFQSYFLQFEDGARLELTV